MKYKNFNIQKFYQKFKKEYTCKINRREKREFSYTVFKNWLNSFIEKDKIFYLMITGIAIFGAIFFFGDVKLYKYFLTLWCVAATLCPIIDYFTTFRDEEKIIADRIIDKIMKEEQIYRSEYTLDILISANQNIDSLSARSVKFFTKSGISQFIKRMGLFFYSVCLALISSEISREGINKANSNLFILFNLLFVISFLVTFFHISMYYFYKISNRTLDLYIEVLNDKKLTMILIENKNERRSYIF